MTYFCIVSSSLQKDMKTDSINISGQSCVTNFIGITEFAKQIQRQEKQRMIDLIILVSVLNQILSCKKKYKNYSTL